MSGVELGLALVGVIDVCYRSGKSLVKTCQAFKDADTRLSEHSVRVEACWIRIETQLQVVRSLAALMDERHRLVQQQILQVLLTKMQIADSKLARLSKPSSSDSVRPARKLTTIEARRQMYALLGDSLVDAISDLEAWQTIFDPTWFLLMKIASPEVDRQLEVTTRQPPPATAQRRSSTCIPAARRLRGALKSDSDASEPSILLQPDGLVPSSIHHIPFSPASTARRAANSQVVLLDPVTCTSRPSISAVLKDIRNFAKRLQYADPFTSGLLECKGILKDESEGSVEAGISKPSSAVTGLTFVFRIPETHPEMQSLRWRLLHWPEDGYKSLSDRFALARQLVGAISYVHIYGFVHKNIRPETVLIISSGSNKYSDDAIGGKEGKGGAAETAVLVGFDLLRDADGKTSRVGDDDWKKNIYRHPSRQSTTPEVDYEMRHDIYSVGVCLLEIGLWESFVAYSSRDGNQKRSVQALPTPADALVAQPHLRPGIGEGDGSGAELLKNPDRVKDRLLRLTRGKLRRKMGTRYSRVVETCLTCLDEDNMDFGDEEEFLDEDGVAVGVRYIEKVLAKLGDIVV